MPEQSEVTAMERAGPREMALTGRMTVNQVEEALKEYLELQRRLDKLMPDQIIEIQIGKNKQRFRKKGYWRAVKKWAQLDVQIAREERIEHGEDWGYLVTVRVTAPNGQAEDGDGSCMASEKFVYLKDRDSWTPQDWDRWRQNGKCGKPKLVLDKDGNPIVNKIKTSENATIHNVRAHAITRAKNRAIADLVGFGEVSAEEIDPRKYERDEHHQSNSQQSRSRSNNNDPWNRSIWKELLQSLPQEQAHELWNRAAEHAGFKASDRATKKQREEFISFIRAELAAIKEQERHSLQSDETPPPESIPDDDRGDAWEAPGDDHVGEDGGAQ